MISPKGVELDGTYNFTDSILFIETFINNETIKITFLSPTKIKMKSVESPQATPLILRKEER